MRLISYMHANIETVDEYAEKQVAPQINLTFFSMKLRLNVRYYQIASIKILMIFDVTNGIVVTSETNHCNNFF